MSDIEGNLVAGLRAERDYERAERNKVYAERNRLVAALSKHYPLGSHLCRDESPHAEAEWLNIVCIHLPTGQATWHIHDRELPLFAHLPMRPAHWDGHSTEEKYERVAALPFFPGSGL